MDRCAVYLMRDGHSGDVKIGISNNPELRRTQVQSHYNVGAVSLIDQTWFLSRDEASKYEKAFHMRYSQHLSAARGGREWFSLSDEQIEGFLTWMKSSTESRTYIIRAIMSKSWKTSSEISKDRWSAFLTGTLVSFFTDIFPLMAGAITQRIEAIFLAPAGVGGICAVRVKKDKVLPRRFGPDGNIVPSDLPEEQLRSMGLLKYEPIWMKDYSITDENGLPSLIPPLNQSTRAANQEAI